MSYLLAMLESSQTCGFWLKQHFYVRLQLETIPLSERGPNFTAESVDNAVLSTAASLRRLGQVATNVNT